jgi:TatD DNase family protein
LAPVPYRGKRNESSYLSLIAAKVASLYGLSIEEVAQRTSENIQRVFSL